MLRRLKEDRTLRLAFGGLAIAAATVGATLVAVRLSSPAPEASPARRAKAQLRATLGQDIQLHYVTAGQPAGVVCGYAGTPPVRDVEGRSTVLNAYAFISRPEGLRLRRDGPDPRFDDRLRAACGSLPARPGAL